MAEPSEEAGGEPAQRPAEDEDLGGGGAGSQGAPLGLPFPALTPVSTDPDAVRINEEQAGHREMGARIDNLLFHGVEVGCTAEGLAGPERCSVFVLRLLFVD